MDLVGGFSTLVQKGWTEAERRLIAALPEVLSTTERVCASVNVGTTAAGINMDAILALGHVLLEEMRKVVTLFAIQTHRTHLHGQHPKHQRRMES
ncbi:MAG: DUF711 family protein [Isosphaeraceae bacterium]